MPQIRTGGLGRSGKKEFKILTANAYQPSALCVSVCVCEQLKRGVNSTLEKRGHTFLLGGHIFIRRTSQFIPIPVIAVLDVI